MIRGDNACALSSYCFKPFADSEEASLNSRSGGSQQLLQEKTLTLSMKCLHSPNQLHTPKDKSTLFWYRRPWQLSSTIPIPSSDLPCMQGSLMSASDDYGFSRGILLDSGILGLFLFSRS